MKYPFVRPSIPPPEKFIPHLEQAYRQKYFTNFGSAEQLLTSELEQRFGAPGVSVVLACNATVALSASLIALGVQGKVAIPAFTFPATLHAVLAARCTPVLCDVVPETGGMCVGSLAAAIDEHGCGAVMPVRPYGFVQDFTDLFDLAESHGLPVVVDAAAAMGGGQVSLRPHVAEVFSLHATKAFGIGEGGAIFLNPSLKAPVMRALNFGLNADRTFSYGLNGKMSEFQAAVGLAQLEDIARQSAGRRDMAEWYFRVLSGYSDLAYIVSPGPTPWSNFPVILPEAVNADQFEQSAHRMGLQIRRYYTPSLEQGFTEQVPIAPGGVAASSRLAARTLCLPLYPECSDGEKAELADMLHALLRQFGLSREG